jgi:hypothetical protein
MVVIPCVLGCLLQNCGWAVVVATLQQAIDAWLSATWKLCCKDFAETHCDHRSGSPGSDL